MCCTGWAVAHGRLWRKWREKSVTRTSAGRVCRDGVMMTVNGDVSKLLRDEESGIEGEVMGN